MKINTSIITIVLSTGITVLFFQNCGGSNFTAKSDILSTSHAANSDFRTLLLENNETAISFQEAEGTPLVIDLNSQAQPGDPNYNIQSITGGNNNSSVKVVDNQIHFDELTLGDSGSYDVVMQDGQQIELDLQVVPQTNPTPENENTGPNSDSNQNSQAQQTPNQQQNYSGPVADQALSCLLSTLRQDGSAGGLHVEEGGARDQVYRASAKIMNIGTRADGDFHYTLQMKTFTRQWVCQNGTWVVRPGRNSESLFRQGPLYHIYKEQEGDAASIHRSLQNIAWSDISNSLSNSQKVIIPRGSFQLILE